MMLLLQAMRRRARPSCHCWSRAATRCWCNCQNSVPLRCSTRCASQLPARPGCATTSPRHVVWHSAACSQHPSQSAQGRRRSSASQVRRTSTLVCAARCCPLSHICLLPRHATAFPTRAGSALTAVLSSLPRQPHAPPPTTTPVCLSRAASERPVLTAAAKEALLAEATGLTPGEPQLLLSLLRLFELAADDTGLREEAMEGLAAVMARALSAHMVAFAERCVRAGGVAASAAVAASQRPS